MLGALEKLLPIGKRLANKLNIDPKKTLLAYRGGLGSRHALCRVGRFAICVMPLPARP